MLFVGMMFSSCGMFDKEVAEAIETESENLIVVGYSQLGSESVWRTANTNSIQTALSKENGFFLQFNNARQKQENQIKALLLNLFQALFSSGCFRNFHSA